MSRIIALGFSAAILTALSVPAAQANDGASFLNQFRYDPKFDQPKYGRYKKRSRKLNNFGTSSTSFGSNNGSGLYFESDTIGHTGTSTQRLDDQKTQIKLKIQF